MHLCREGIRGNQLKVDVADILSYNDELAKYVEENPSDSLPLVRRRPAGGTAPLYITRCQPAVVIKDAPI